MGMLKDREIRESLEQCKKIQSTIGQAAQGDLTEQGAQMLYKDALKVEADLARYAQESEGQLHGYAVQLLTVQEEITISMEDKFGFSRRDYQQLS